SKNIVAYNVFTTELGGVAKDANKTTVIINPSTIIPNEADSLVASVGMSFRDEWGWLFNTLLFIFVFFFFSILFLYYKISWR
ncbi:hypothetical protein KKA27_03425, partial [Patescibacteria group bacterium]|nr:hypothetical protein [Patescibacteria group bacterium]